MSEPNLYLGFLTAAGLWPFRYWLPKKRHQWWNSDAINNLFSLFVMWQVTSLFAQLALALFVYELTFTELVTCGSNTWVILFTVLKMVTFHIQRKDLDRLVKMCNEMYKKIQNSTSAAAHTIFRQEKRARFVRGLNMAYYWVITLTPVGLWVSPVAEVYLLEGPSATNNSTRDLLFLQRYGIPVTEYFPFELKDHLPFCWVYELITCSLAGLFVTAPDMFVFAILNELISHCDVVLIMFSDLTQTSQQFKIGEPKKDEKAEKTTQDGLRKAILHHIATLQFGRDIETFCRSFMALQISVAVGTICCTTFLLSKETALPTLMTLLQYFATGIALAFLVCIFAENVQSKSGAIAFAAYSCNWLEEDLTFQKQIIFCIFRSQREIQLTALRTLKISLKLFVSVVRQSYSVLTIIQQIDI